VRATMSELPEARRRRFVEAYGLPDYDAGVLTQSKGLADYFEEVAAVAGSPKAASNWVMGDVLRVLNASGGDSGVMPVTAAALGGLLTLIARGVISGAIAKDVFQRMCESGRSADSIVESEGLAQIGDEAAILDAVRGVLSAHPDVVSQYRGGRQQVLGFLVGQVMKGTGGKANPALVNQLLRRELAS